MSQERDQTIADVLQASDGHFGRLVTEVGHGNFVARREDPPWFRELARVIQVMPEIRARVACLKAAAAREKAERVAKLSPWCTGSGSVAVKVVPSRYGNPRAICPRCGRDSGTAQQGSAWVTATHKDYRKAT